MVDEQVLEHGAGLGAGEPAGVDGVVPVEVIEEQVRGVLPALLRGQLRQGGLREPVGPNAVEVRVQGLRQHVRGALGVVVEGGAVDPGGAYQVGHGDLLHRPLGGQPQDRLLEP